MTDHVGEQFGDYRLTQLVGKGNFGDVYLGEHIKNKKRAAVKVLHARLTSKEDLKEYINEIRTLFRLEHPNIVRLRDFGVEKDFPYFVTDYIPNGKLRQPKGTRLPLDIVVSYVKQIAEALQYAHDQGILHRDVKPDNILLGPNSQVWLSDFGIAAVAHSTNSLDTQGNAGTLAYMAPEQIQGKPGKASDQYSLGIMAYEWICGTRPFNGTSNEIYNQHLLTNPPSMREYVPILPLLIEEVVLKALAKDPKQRFANVRAFANALEQAYMASLTPEPTLPMVPELIEPALRQQPPVPVETAQILVPVQQPIQQPEIPVTVVPPPVATDNLITMQNIPSPSTTTFPEQGKGNNRRRSTRRLLAILLVILTLLLLASIAFASPPGQNLLGHITGTTVTATVTITPDHPIVSESFVVTAVTGTPDPAALQVKARTISYTSPSQSASAGATGSIPGARASGTLVFANIGNGVQISGGTLTGSDGVQVSFSSFFAPFGSIAVTGTAENQGRSGDIPALDINGSCCGSANIRVRNPSAFSGGQDSLPNLVITPNDINRASNNLISKIKPSAQSALQQQVQANEQVVNGSLKCTTDVTANQRVGDQAESVTVTGTATCSEEVFDQKGALALASNAFKADVAKKPQYAGYALVGNVVTGITSETVIDTKGTVSLVILAQGVWVYQFTDTILTGIKNKIGKEPESSTQSDINGTQGVMSATISISSGTTMPTNPSDITIKVVQIPGLTGSPTPTPTTPPSRPTTSPAITPTTGLGGP